MALCVARACTCLSTWFSRYPLNTATLVKPITASASATSASSAVISLMRSGVRCAKRVIASSGCRNALSAASPSAPVLAMIRSYEDGSLRT